MADTKITALSALTAADPANDVLPIVDVNDPFMAASGTTKKISINNILGASGTATLASATISGDLTVDTSTLKVDSTNNRVGIGTATPAYPLDVNGNARIGTDGLGFGRLTVSKSTSAAFLNLSLAATSGYTELMFTNFNDNTGATGWSSYIRSNTNAASNYASDLVFGTSAAATGNPIERYKIASDGVATWSNVGGVAGTAMTLNSTGLGVGVAPAVGLDILNVTPQIRLRGTGTTSEVRVNSAYGGAALGAIGTIGAHPFMLMTNNTQALTVDASQNVGIGVTPSAWGSAYKTISNLLYADYYSNNGGIIGISGNAYNNGTSWIYKNTTAAHRYEQSIGSGHIWFNAPSGTSGTAITFTQAMTLDASGNLLVGTTATAGSASNSTKTVGGIFSSVNGTSASTASGSAVTLFASQSEATYMVSAYVFGTGAPATYNAVAIVKTNAGVATITTISSATNLTISISGLNVQVTQTSGVSQVITYNVIRIS